MGVYEPKRESARRKLNLMSQYDAVLILGGGVREGGALPAWVANRFDRALELDTRVFICLSGGTAHRPLPRAQDGSPIFESVAGARYLIERGIDPQRIFFETASFDTLGNAYFSRAIHIDPMRLTNLVVITSEFHMPRTEAIFRWVYRLDAPAGRYRLRFEATPDVGFERKALHERRNREQISLQQVLETEPRIKTLREFHHWLFTEHALYATGLRNNPKEVVTEVIQSTY